MSPSPRVAWFRLIHILLVGLFLLGCNAVLGADKGGSKASTSEQGCTAGTVDCGGSCVATTSNDNHCGACGTVCGAGQYCNGGVCETFCPSGSLECNAECRVSQSDVFNCGTCGTICPVGQYCDSGACSATCTGSICPSATGNNVCAHLSSNNENCGACGVACGPGMACQAGACVKACAEGRLSCGDTCVDVRSDAVNCGSCGNVCPAGVACVEGACGNTAPVCSGGSCACVGGTQDCNGTCVDIKANALHCGACGVACATGQSCVGGVCACPNGGTLCGGACTNVTQDSANCGMCGKVCTGGTTCQAGSCACDLGKNLCDTTCADFKTDPLHCGDCMTACEGYESCVEGICKYDGDQCGGDARNIDITHVSMYQAVELDLFDGAMVPKDSRAVDVVQGRAGMIRVFVTPKAGFTARELSARVFVENDGDIQVFHHKRNVSGASTQSSLDSTFQLEVPADLIRGTTKFWIELAECATLPTGTVGTVRVPTTPGVNGEFAAVATGVIKVVFVPLSHDGRVPDTSAQTIAVYSKEIQKLYPATNVEASVRAVVNSNQSGSSIDLGYTLDQVTDLRGSDNVAEDVYYYGLIDPASSFSQYCQGGCTTGVGWVPDADGWGIDHRAAVGIGFGTYGVGTFAHELGHNHGREHAPCGNPGGPDSNYPYSGAAIGTWGYDMFEKELIEPSEHKDFMSYCDPTWVSDYTYQAFIERVAIVNGASSFQKNVSSPQPLEEWHRMLVTPSGAKWRSSVKGPGAPGKRAEKGSVYDEVGNVVATVDTYRVDISDGGGYMLYVPAPQAGWFAVAGAGGPIMAY